MLVSHKWLEELLNTTLDVNRLKRICLNLGLEVEAESRLAPEGIVVGKINKMSPHPRLKNLSVLEVKADRVMTIVTAARNVKQGDRILVGPAGATVYGQEILKRDFEGITSQGIFISEEELKLADKSTGVIVVEKGKPGASFSNVFDDIVLDIKTTPNRPDWLSVEGIARELAIGLGVQYTGIYRKNLLRQINRTGSVRIAIQDTHGCPRYTARIFDGVTIKESPFWMKWRLHCMGMKAINNIVDVTNIIMLLSGQPLHPFDADLLKGGIII
jgi:phenylalanyl-tRNA synthetase beta chain